MQVNACGRRAAALQHVYCRAEPVDDVAIRLGLFYLLLGQFEVETLGNLQGVWGGSVGRCGRGEMGGDGGAPRPSLQIRL